jgi:cytochrome c
MKLRHGLIGFLAAVFAILAGAPASAGGPVGSAQLAAADDGDEWGGLPPGEGRETVYGLCSACHSLKLVTQQGLSQKSWDETIDWMVEEQGMPELDPETHRLVVDYLAEHYGPESRGDSSLSGWGRPTFD